jgi:hypothetical protein
VNTLRIVLDGVPELLLGGSGEVGQINLISLTRIEFIGCGDGMELSKASGSIL